MQGKDITNLLDSFEELPKGTKKAIQEELHALKDRLDVIEKEINTVKKEGQERLLKVRLKYIGVFETTVFQLKNKYPETFETKESKSETELKE